MEKGRHASSEKRKEKTDGKPVKPTNLDYFPLQDEHCHSPASLLGETNTGMWGFIPMGEGTQRWLGFRCPFPLFCKLRQDLANLCLSSFALSSWEDFPAS